MLNLKESLKELSIEELKTLAKDIRTEIDSRIIDLKDARADVMETFDEYNFYFKSENNRRDMPYVAKCVYVEGKGLKRRFKDLETTYAGSYVVVEGDYKAKELEVLDIAYRNYNFGTSGFYIVLNKELKLICEKDDALKISTLKQYLKGAIRLENFLEIVGIKKIEAGAVMNELLED